MSRPRFALLVAALALASAWGCSGATSTNTAPGADGGSSDPDASSGSDGDTTTDGGSAADSASAADAGPLPPMTSAITIIVEPGDNAAGLINAIKAAKTSVHMTMYLLSNNNIMNALIGAKNAGHDVKVLLNQNFTAGTGSNTTTFNTLTQNGVNVKWAPAGFTLTHEKCVIIDATTAWIMTMNATQTSPTDNREYLAVDTDPADVAEAEAIFQADFANQSSSPSGNLVVAPNNARGRLKALIDTATTTIDMEAEELSDNTIVASLAAAQDRGVRVRIVVASGNTSANQQAAVALLKQHGVKLVEVTTPYIHAKSIVADGARAYVGSENFSAGSLNSNRELGVITNAATEVAKVTNATAADFAIGKPL